ncbi:hypothetical protein [Thermomonas sp.]|uniref:hypothetical protein n=1 Tax=Thermomonas sp. TaxID=1971895 RepID=UPI0035AFD78D
MPRKPAQTAGDGSHLTHERIADDLKAFRKRGGRIEVLGNTPLRSANNASPFRSSPELRKPPTPVTRARKA